MSDFSVITPLNTATISRSPSYSKGPQVQAAPDALASTPVDAYGYPQQKKKATGFKTLDSGCSTWHNSSNFKEKS